MFDTLMVLREDKYHMKDWISGALGEPAEQAYKAMHLITTAIVLFFVILFSIIASINENKVSAKTKNIILKSICIFQLFFEVLWRELSITVNHSEAVALYPMYPCNLGGILIPIISLLDLKVGKKMFYLFGFIGGVLTFIMPQGIFCSTVFSFPILKSVLQHTGLLLIPTFEFFMKKYRPYAGDYLWLVLGCIVHTINCEVIDRLLGLTGDYMYFRSGLPFVIKGVPSWLTISAFALIVFYVLTFVLSFKDSVEYYKSGKWKEKYIIKKK